MNNPTPYIPNEDVALADWATNFADLITAVPADFGLTAPEAVIIQAQADAFTAAYLLANEPATRSPVTVAGKDAARTNMLAIIRPFATAIARSPAVSDPDKVAVGVTVPKTTRSRIALAGVGCVLALRDATPARWRVDVRDPVQPSSKQRPYGARCIQYEVTITTQADAPFGSYVHIGTRHIESVPINGAIHGLKYSIRARYQGAQLAGGAPNNGDWSNTITGNVP